MLQRCVKARARAKVFFQAKGEQRVQSVYRTWKRERERLRQRDRETETERQRN